MRARGTVCVTRSDINLNPRDLESLNHRATEDPAGTVKALNPLEMVVRYHQETKHHFSRSARALGYMDWANQPDPFRRYEGSPLIALPRLKPDDAPLSPLYEDLYRPGVIASAPVTLSTLSRFFEYSLAISAWKQAGEVRWALRTNPSSGNLHPPAKGSSTLSYGRMGWLTARRSCIDLSFLTTQGSTRYGSNHPGSDYGVSESGD